MISFIVSAVVLVLLAVVFIVPTLRKKNYAFSDEYDDLNVSIAKDRLKEIKSQLDAGEITQQIYQQLHDELESSLALDLSNIDSTQQSTPSDSDSSVKSTSKWMPILLAICIPLFSAAIYFQLGDFAAATGTKIVQTVIPAGENRPQMTIEEAINKLEQRLVDEPNNADGWFMLGKTYMAIKQYNKSVAAYEKVLKLDSENQQAEDPEVLLRYADAIAMTEGGNLNGKARPIIDRIIVMLPNNPTALWMAGMAENQQENYSQALSFWYKLHPIVSQDAGSVAQLDTLIKGAEAQLSSAEVTQLKKAASFEASTTQDVNGDTAAQIIVTVKLDPALKDKVKPTDTLFVFAKAMQGPPMPLAAVKKTVAELPLTVSLNDAMAMMPQMKLSNFEQVKISAVITQSGQPGAQAGDLFVEMSPVNVKTQEKITLIINQIK